MRREPTEPEKRLWRHLSNSQLDGYKFRRQTVIGKRIVDFFCPSIGLVIEVDGHTHDPYEDAVHDRAMRGQGFEIIRVTNSDVMANMEGVLLTILDAARARASRTVWRLPPPQPLP